MKFFDIHKREFVLILTLMIVAQFVFAMISPGFTKPRFEGRIYATTAVKHKQEDLHKLNEAAHYFGQTMIGWLKFPNFFSKLNEQVALPEGASMSAHIQERQNIIFTVNSPTPLEKEELMAVTDYVQERIDVYNTASLTEFNLTNLDYELVEIKRSYRFGAMVTLLSTLVISLALVFIRKEFK